MCGPLALPIAAAAVAAGGQLYGGLAANANSKYEQRVAERNRTIELRSRDDAMARGEVEQMRHWRRVAQQIGEQRAQQAASGVDVSFGSAADLLEDVSLIGYEDSGIIAENTAREVRSYDINAANYRMEGRAARSRGRNALIGSGINAISTILGSATQIGKMNRARSTASFGG